jgi:hypothetical protein
MHPAGVKAQLKGNSAGATLHALCMDKTVERNVLSVDREPCGPYGIPHARKRHAAPRMQMIGAGDDMFNGMEINTGAAALRRRSPW